MESSAVGDRIIVLVDLDCFFVQVEQKLYPEYLNKPCAVVQYKNHKGGSIVAVNYEARAKGVTRFMRGNEAKEKCPDINLLSTQEIRGKADLTKYREAASEVLDVVCEYSDCVEKGSMDEAYLDMTSVITSQIQKAPPVTADQLPNTFVVGWEGESPESQKDELKKWLQMIYEEDHLYNDRMLAVAAVIVEEMRAAVYEKTGYRCSAGIAHNKMLSKLSCGINKPNKQTVLPQSSIQILFRTIPIKKVRNLGGKLGHTVRKKFDAENMGDLIDVPRSQFVSQFGEKTGLWLYNLVRGIENEPVTSRQLTKSIGCCKNFGKAPLKNKHDVVHWLKQLAVELEERLIKDQNDNRRFARLLTVGVRNFDGSGYPLVTRSCPIHEYNAEKLAHDALVAVSKLNTSSSEVEWKPCIHTLSIAASKFETKLDSSLCNIQSYLVNGKNYGSENKIKNKIESELSASRASVSSEFRKIQNNTMSNSSKSISSTNIASFFARKQSVDTESGKNAEINNTIHISNQSCKQNASNCLIVEKRDVELENSDVTNTLTKKNLEDTPNKDTKIQEFSAKRDIQDFSSCLVEENTEKYNQITKETSTKDNPEDITKTASKPLGFFAKKLAEHSGIKLNIDFTPPLASDNVINNEQMKENETAMDKNDLFVPSTSVFDTASSLDPELTKVCELCHKRIPLWEETEHLDYHVALDLSKEVTSKPAQYNDSIVNKSSVSKKSSAKSKGISRKRGSVAKPSQAKKSFVQKNTLDAFIK